MKCYFVSPDDGEPSDPDDDDSGSGITSLSPALLARHGARILDPSAVPVAEGWPLPLPTVYRTRTLLVPPRLQDDPYLPVVDGVLSRVGMSLEPVTTPGRGGDVDGLPADIPVVAVLKAAAGDGQPPAVIDAWTALTALRAAAGRGGVDERGETALDRGDVAQISLEHLLLGAAITGSPAVDGSPVTSYLSGTGDSRIPVELYADAPHRPSAGDCTRSYGRRPVIAVLDTGAREHPWLNVKRAAPPEGYRTEEPDGFVQVDPAIQKAILDSAEAVRKAGDPARQLIRHPWDTPVTADPLVGELDVATGHGVYIAGIVRQVVPEAKVLSIRIMHSDDVVAEGDLIEGLRQVLLRVARAQDSEHPRPDQMVDVVSLSLGYFCESPRDFHYTSGLKIVIDELLDRGVMVVAAAGNYAVRRRYYPAAFADALRPPGTLPVVSGGALNPNGTRALFSDGGRWVTAWASGAVAVSTFPVDLNGSLMPPVEEPDGGEPAPGPGEPAAGHPRRRTRDSLDPDDFSGGFAAWSGTSFAAPALAAWLLRALLDGAASDPALTLGDPAPAAAVSRALHALRRRGWREL